MKIPSRVLKVWMISDSWELALNRMFMPHCLRLEKRGQRGNIKNIRAEK